jgi:hypothetical protein
MCHPSNSSQSFGVSVDTFPSSSALEMEAYKETANKILKVGSSSFYLFLRQFKILQK